MNMKIIVPIRVSGHRDWYVNVAISADDKDIFAQSKWLVVHSKTNNRMIVQGVVNNKSLYLTHAIMGKPPLGHVVDHIDNDTLNNTRDNLRFASFALNAQNRTKQESVSGYRGVSPSGSKWYACCSQTYLGSFDTAIEAAQQYDAFVVMKYGVGARRNFPCDPINEYTAPKRQKLSLPTGVRRIRCTERYMAVLAHASLGTFDSIEEASNAYQDALQERWRHQEITLASIPIDYNQDGIPIVPATRAGQQMAYVKCDPEMWHELLRNKMTLTVDGYPQTHKGGKTVSAHRFVVGAKPGEIVDHINRDRCDARRANLRIVTAQENAQNRGGNSRNLAKSQTSGNGGF